MGLRKIKIVSDGTIGGQGARKGTRILFEEAGVDGVWVDLSSVVSRVEWEIDASAKMDMATATIHVVLPMLEAAAENIKVIIEGLAPSITDWPLVCDPCGWHGTVGDAIPDIDKDGGLGCPDCGRLLNSRMGNAPCATE